MCWGTSSHARQNKIWRIFVKYGSKKSSLIRLRHLCELLYACTIHLVSNSQGKLECIAYDVRNLILPSYRRWGGGWLSQTKCMVQAYRSSHKCCSKCVQSNTVAAYIAVVVTINTISHITIRTWITIESGVKMFCTSWLAQELTAAASSSARQSRVFFCADPAALAKSQM